jgi:y4mF family transcriptional regulator
MEHAGHDSAHYRHLLRRLGAVLYAPCNILRISTHWPAQHDVMTEDGRDRAQGSSLGTAIRRRRKALGLTQEELAALAGCARRSVSALEAGKRTVRLDIVLGVLEVLGLRLRVEPGRGPVVASDE